MLIFPAIDILGGKCVRLYKGDFQQVKKYSDDPLLVAKNFVDQGANVLHIIDLDGAKNGKPLNEDIILKIANSVKVPISVGGGIRDFASAKKYLPNGIKRIILSTAAISKQSMIKKLVQDFGSDRIVVSLDILNGDIAINGWQNICSNSVSKFLKNLKNLGIKKIIVTDISKDGTLNGPNFKLIKSVVDKGFKVIAAGGITKMDDLKKLDKIGCYGAIIGKAIYEKNIELKDACKIFSNENNLAIRIIPCMDVANFRVVKGVNFKNLKDAGSPVELGKYYSKSGADELVFLDITATIENRKTLYKLVKKIAKNVYIPFTVGGGIKTLEDIRELLNSGADKIAICSYALKNPEFVKAAAKKFGSQCIVISLDCKKNGDRFELYINGGRLNTSIDAIEFAKKMELFGAGELLINSLDRDGTKTGYDIELLSKISSAVNIPIIASSGAGNLKDFSDAISLGRADAVLAASLFHSKIITISDLKKYLINQNLKVRI